MSQLNKLKINNQLKKVEKGISSSSLMTFKTVFESQTPSIGAICREYKDSDKLIGYWIASASKMVNVKRQITPEQVMFLANHISSEYRQLPSGVILRALKQGVTGKKGDNFNCLDVPTVCKWIDSEYEEYLSFVAIERQREHENIKKSPVMNKSLSKELSKVVRTIEDIKVKDYYSACMFNGVDSAEKSKEIRNEVEKYCIENEIDKSNISILVDRKKNDYYKQTLTRLTNEN